MRWTGGADVKAAAVIILLLSAVHANTLKEAPQVDLAHPERSNAETLEERAWLNPYSGSWPRYRGHKHKYNPADFDNHHAIRDAKSRCDHLHKDKSWAKHSSSCSSISHEYTKSCVSTSTRDQSSTTLASEIPDTTITSSSKSSIQNTFEHTLVVTTSQMTTRTLPPVTFVENHITTETPKTSTVTKSADTLIILPSASTTTVQKDASTTTVVKGASTMTIEKDASTTTVQKDASTTTVYPSFVTVSEEASTTTIIPSFVTIPEEASTTTMFPSFMTTTVSQTPSTEIHNYIYTVEGPTTTVVPPPQTNYVVYPAQPQSVKTVYADIDPVVYYTPSPVQQYTYATPPQQYHTYLDANTHTPPASPPPYTYVEPIYETSDVYTFFNDIMHNPTSSSSAPTYQTELDAKMHTHKSSESKSTESTTTTISASVSSHQRPSSASSKRSRKHSSSSLSVASTITIKSSPQPSSTPISSTSHGSGISAGPTSSKQTTNSRPSSAVSRSRSYRPSGTVRSHKKCGSSTRTHSNPSQSAVSQSVSRSSKVAASSKSHASRSFPCSKPSRTKPSHTASSKASRSKPPCYKSSGTLRHSTIHVTTTATKVSTGCSSKPLAFSSHISSSYSMELHPVMHSKSTSHKPSSSIQRPDCHRSRKCHRTSSSLVTVTKPCKTSITASEYSSISSSISETKTSTTHKTKTVTRTCSDSTSSATPATLTTIVTTTKVSASCDKAVKTSSSSSKCTAKTTKACKKKTCPDATTTKYVKPHAKQTTTTISTTSTVWSLVQVTSMSTDKNCPTCQASAIRKAMETEAAQVTTETVKRMDTEQTPAEISQNLDINEEADDDKEGEPQKKSSMAPSSVSIGSAAYLCIAFIMINAIF